MSKPPYRLHKLVHVVPMEEVMLQVLRGDAIWCFMVEGDEHVHGAGVGFLGALALGE